MKRSLLALLILLTACTPGTNSLDSQAQPATQPTAARVRWNAVVTGPDLVAGSYQGELGSAVMTGDTVLALDLSNIAYSGGGEGLFDVPVDSRPLGLAISFDPPEAVALLNWSLPSGVFDDPERTFSTGDLSGLQLSRQGNLLTGTMRFVMSNRIGQTVTLTLTDLALRVQE